MRISIPAALAALALAVSLVGCNRDAGKTPAGATSPSPGATTTAPPAAMPPASAASN